jgi:predicted phage tail component-like protein
MNSFYDFSTVASNGEQIYGQRTIEIKFYFKGSSRGELRSKFSDALKWMKDVGQTPLLFDETPDIFFLAEDEQTPQYKEVSNTLAEVTVAFICEPFKMGVQNQGNMEWDTFNFLEDALQDVEFDVTGSKTVSIYNPGRVIVPAINCNAQMTATVGTYTANLISGDNKDYSFKLQNGDNSITINGTGHIKFTFRKEML